MVLIADVRMARTQERKALVLEMCTNGISVLDALSDPRVGVSYSAYRQWRQRDPKWAAKIDVARANAEKVNKLADMTSAQFAARYFNRVRAPFQQQAINAMETMRPGNILLMLWPPEHGKTSTFEDYATEKLCRQPNWRNTTASADQSISKKIVGRVRKRFEPDGPTPMLVKEWGPFRPDAGRGQGSAFYQPWNDLYFNVRAKQSTDERDYNMFAIGWKKATISIRADHLHMDDVQSVHSLGATDKIMAWLRQDALARTGESGINTLAMTRIGDGDIGAALEDDDDLDGILTIIKFRAIVKNPITGEDEPLWPAAFTMDKLERIRRKIKDPAFDAGYLMAPGASKTKRTFSDDGKILALDRKRRLNEPGGFDGRPTVVLSLDPGLDPGICVLQGWVIEADAMHLVYEKEDAKLLRNEQIIDMVNQACIELSPHFKVAHLTVEAMNFQRGLARDERLASLKRRWGFTMAEHLTNINKYDENIGVASMAGDWEAGKIRLPYDPTHKATQDEIDELCRQLKAWRPLARGSKLRQDRVMTMWFAWIYWQLKRGKPAAETQQWQRQGIPWAPKQGSPSLIIPIGVSI